MDIWGYSWMDFGRDDEKDGGALLNDGRRVVVSHYDLLHYQMQGFFNAGKHS
jgi:hypothetical protein